MIDDRWIPANGTEFMGFVEYLCMRCKFYVSHNDAENGCALFNQGIDALVGLGETPEEWRTDGIKVTCQKFEVKP